MDGGGRRKRKIRSGDCEKKEKKREKEAEAAGSFGGWGDSSVATMTEENRSAARRSGLPVSFLKRQISSFALSPLSCYGKKRSSSPRRKPEEPAAAGRRGCCCSRRRRRRRRLCPIAEGEEGEENHRPIARQSRARKKRKRGGKRESIARFLFPRRKGRESEKGGIFPLIPASPLL